MRRKLRGEFEENPDKVREVLARGGPPVLTAAGAAYRERLLALADEAMNRLEGGTADALRRLAKQIREQGDRAVPAETPDEVAERERDYRRHLAAQEVA
ncbi:MAG: hypothetical protein M9894_39715 [Planctomycetes bacterium]|nr:hypothetical protein [Planctomycetota bacterium]